MKRLVKYFIFLTSLSFLSAFASCSDDTVEETLDETEEISSGSGQTGTSGSDKTGTGSSGGSGTGNTGTSSSGGSGSSGSSGGNGSAGTGEEVTVTKYLYSSSSGTSNIGATITSWGNGGDSTPETELGIGNVLKVTPGTVWGASAACVAYTFGAGTLAAYDTFSFKIYTADMTVTNASADKDIVVKVPETEIPISLSEYGQAISGKSGWYNVSIPLSLWSDLLSGASQIAVLQRCTGSFKITDIAISKTVVKDNTPQSEAAGSYRSGMSIVWQDEFDSADADGTPLSSKWHYDVGRGQSNNSDGTNPGNWAWGNNEVQWYSDNKPSNTYVSDGTLKIVAKRENAESDATWTSGRLVTRNKYENKYGCIEMRAKITEAAGMWPAFWMLRHDIYDAGGTGWPAGGEIDIMESSTSVWGAGNVFGTLHCTGGSGGNPIWTKGKQLSELEDLWHTYAVVWKEEGTISWYYDDVLLGTYTASNVNNNDVWPYDENFYIILNLAVGGNLGGTIDPNLSQATMEVDYVRWYK